MSAYWSLFLDLMRRELRGKMSQSGTGWVWLVVSPLLMLAVYGFVFGVIFAARVPEGLEVTFIAWLAVALWPWLAFADSVQQAANSMSQHRALLSKVALPRELLALSSQAATFTVHAVSYLLVLVVLQWLGNALTWSGIGYLLLLLLLLQGFAAGLGLVLATVQVFFRDLKQILPIVMMLWFFLTPILYAPEMLPVELRAGLQFNPMTWWMDEIRAALFAGKAWPTLSLLPLLALSSVGLALGLALFKRMAPHFEDFL